MKSLFMLYLAGQALPAIATLGKHAGMLDKTVNIEQSRHLATTLPASGIVFGKPQFPFGFGLTD